MLLKIQIGINNYLFSFVSFNRQDQIHSSKLLLPNFGFCNYHIENERKEAKSDLFFNTDNISVPAQIYIGWAKKLSNNSNKNE